jgi:Ribbon-helix-helix protein, copG family
MEFPWNGWNIEHIGKHGVLPDEAELSPPNKMTKSKPYWKMTPDELSKATDEFDEPLVIDKSRALTPAERTQWDRVRRKRGRPKVGKGFKRVSLSLEQDLLTRVTDLAKKRHISRSRLIALVLTDALAQDK